MIVAIYARFSSLADLEKTSSIEAQIQMCQQKAVEDGWMSTSKTNTLRTFQILVIDRVQVISFWKCKKKIVS